MGSENKVPVHVGMIMDGNGRWAKRRGLPRLLGHKAGVTSLEKIVRASKDLGIRYVSFYAFSTENWNRPKMEVIGLMKIFKYYLRKKIDELVEEDARLRFCGSRDGVPQEILDIMDFGEERTRDCETIDMIVCFNYGGRQEIVDAIRKARELGEEIRSVEDVQKYLYLPDVPDPDLIIRTSGELRLSNYLLWESSYSEYYFTDTLWPDFSKEELVRAIEHFNGRDRRYGKVK